MTYGQGTTFGPVTPKLPERPTFPKSKDMAFVYHWGAESYGICLVGVIVFLLRSELHVMKHACILLCKHYIFKNMHAYVCVRTCVCVLVPTDLVVL